jgi:hypothetical protein
MLVHAKPHGARFAATTALTVLTIAFGACGGGSSADGNGAGAGTGFGGSIYGSGGGAGSVIGTGGGSTGTGANGNGTLDPDSACLADARQGEQVPIDLYFMVDITGSMKCPIGPAGNTCEVDPGPPYAMTTRWTEESKALKAFLSAGGNDGLGVGIDFFPVRTGDICDAANYTTPAVEIAPLPGAAGPIGTAIDQQMPGGNTPTVASLTGAVQHANAWAAAHTDRRVAIVYMTDGYPKSCAPGNTIPAAAQVAQGAAAMGIVTYVLGVGPNLMDLNQIATAGGTMQAYLVDTGQDVATQFATALNSIRSRALTCNYRIPASTSGPLDYEYVNVNATIGSGGTPSGVRRVAGSMACDGGGGWYYDNNAAPTIITLCPATCDPLLNTPGSSLQVLIGCNSNGGIPR